MTKFTQGEREEIERIKGEYYCGTRKALSVLKKRQELQGIAEKVNGELRAVGEQGVNWQTAYALMIQVETIRLIRDEHDLLEQQLILEVSDFTIRSAKKRANRLGLPLEALLTIEYVGLKKEGGEDFEMLCGLAGRISELYLMNENGRLVYEDAVAYDLPKNVPVHMASPNTDKLYVRAREEGVLHAPDVQRLFLVQTAQAAGITSVDDLRAHFRELYTGAQGKSYDYVGEEDADLLPCLQQVDALTADAATYGLGLLRHSDVSGWLRKYLGA